MLLDKTGTSCIAGHIHTFDHAVRTNIAGKTRVGLIVGCYQDYDNDWAGNIAHLWRRGVAVLRNVKNGDFDLEWWSLERLKEEYGEPE